MIVVSIVAMGMGLMGQVTAQDDATNESEDELGSDEIDIDAETTITDFEFDDGQVSITIESETNQPALVSDGLAGIDQEGATRVPEQEYDLTPGSNELRMSVESINGDSSVAVSTQGGTIRLSTGMDPQQDPSPFSRTPSAAGWFGGALTTLAMIVAAAWKIKTEDHDDVEVVE
ncbi:hypothetical protein ACLI4Z_16435 [Natrialbaceae archaeon A-arb3/5]